MITKLKSNQQFRIVSKSIRVCLPAQKSQFTNLVSQISQVAAVKKIPFKKS